MAELKTFVFTDISGSVRLKDEMVGRSVTERDQAFIYSILTPLGYKASIYRNGVFETVLDPMAADCWNVFFSIEPLVADRHT